MAKKNKLSSGDIFQIVLPENLGWGYCKYIDLLEIDPSFRYSIIVRVFNLRTDTPIIDVQSLESHGLLFSPLLVAGILSSVKEGIWRYLDNLPVSEKEQEIPHYRFYDDRKKEWFYALDADKFHKAIKSDYDSVKHLELLSAMGSSILPTKIAMALLLEEEKKIEDHFKLEEYFEKEIYREVTEMTPYYKLPDYMKDKALNAKE
jgi:hypothetical protein